MAALFEQTTLFKDGDLGYFRYRIPALITTCTGTVIAFCEARRYNGRDYDEINIAMKRSADGGATWDDTRIIAADGEDAINQPCPVQDHHTGTIWLPFCKNNQWVFVMKSTDDGITWSEPVDITEQVKDSTWSYLGTGPGHGIQLASGRLLIPSWVDESPGPVTWAPSPNWGKIQSSYVIYSDDHGATWQRGEKLTANLSDECEVVEIEDGSIYMSMRSRQGKKCRAFAWSRDGGITWTPVEFDATLLEPSCQGSLIRYTGRDRSSKCRVLFTAPSDTEARIQLTARVSYDECQTWPVSRVLCEGRSGYSDLTVAPDMTILCLFETSGDMPESQQLALARFNLEWLTFGADYLDG